LRAIGDLRQSPPGLDTSTRECHDDSDAACAGDDHGLRPDEVIRMRWDNVLWDRNLIFNQDGKTDKSPRYAPLSDRCTLSAIARLTCWTRSGNLNLVQRLPRRNNVTTQKYLHPEVKGIAELVHERNAEHASESLRHSRGSVQ
jgi:integrase